MLLLRCRLLSHWVDHLLEHGVPHPLARLPVGDGDLQLRHLIVQEFLDACKIRQARRDIEALPSAIALAQQRFAHHQRVEGCDEGATTAVLQLRHLSGPWAGPGPASSSYFSAPFCRSSTCMSLRLVLQCSAACEPWCRCQYTVPTSVLLPASVGALRYFSLAPRCSREHVSGSASGTGHFTSTAFNCRDIRDSKRLRSPRIRLCMRSSLALEDELTHNSHSLLKSSGTAS